MDPIVLAAGTAVVSAMATDAWQQTRAAVVEWWRGARPGQAEAVDAALAGARTRILTARQSGDAADERELVSDWQTRLQSMLREDPALAGGLRRLLDEDLAPALPAEERQHLGSLVMRATADGQGRVYQAGRDLNITER